jgi:5-methyltetrahydropteroyltriglutamate--homocysteine methyltransferase
MKTDRTKALPRFFTQVIGSLPRPTLVRDLIDRRESMPTDEYKRVMDDMVLFAIRLQEQAGLDVISDGEWRRVHYLDEFLLRVGGHERIRPFEHQGEQKHTTVVTGKMQRGDPLFADDASFLTSHTDRCTKYALPSPFLIAIRKWHEDFSTDAYPTIDHYMEHLTELLADEAQVVAQTGVDMIQLDDPALTYFCDRRLTGEGQTHDERLKREWDIDRQAPAAIAAVNQIAAELPVEVQLHCCHSVYKRQSDVTGDYKPILPFLADAKINRVNLEFAYHGTGEASDLELLPKHLGVGMGVVDVRSEALQEVEDIERIGAAGAQFVDPSRIALNPDCGFAPDYGEPPSIDEAYEKLSRLSAAAAGLRKRFTSQVS